MSIRHIVLAAGGTGGHIFPAISFGQWLAREHPEIKVSYICGARSLEREIYKSCGIDPTVLGINGSPLGVRGFGAVRRVLDMARSFCRSIWILHSKAPDVCLVFGGYVSAPVLMASLINRIPTAAHEQNAASGRITRVASKLGIKVLAGWPRCGGISESSARYVGIPTREFERMSRAEALGRMGVQHLPDRKIVAVMTGSLGSAGIMERISSSAASDKMKDICTFVILGGSDKIRCTENVVSVPRMWDPSPIFSAADVVISRAGGSTLAELAALDIPTITIPWGASAGDHQRANAACFADEDPRRRFVWDEELDTVETLTQNILKCIESNNNIGEKMYNDLIHDDDEIVRPSERTGANVSRRLMDELEALI